MPKRKDIKSILILGAGPIIIGQACEFDYAGTQACKALREEGYKIILVNSNPATIMTDPHIADSTYIEPIQWKTVKKIIKKEKPTALLPTMGGQTALNCTLKLHKHGILKKFNVEIIGATIQSIEKAENRFLFDKEMQSIGLKTAKCKIVKNLKKAIEAIKEIGFPCVIRPSFTMGGAGGGIAKNIKEYKKICKRGFSLSPTKELLIDESLIGWKEYEMEVIRDKKDNCIIVCSIENIDPMGIHTGDSITVAPAQTLTDTEYQKMRNASIKVLRKIGVETGGSNVQFAINPKNGKMTVIEMNPRVSRSSALASKATGFPIAKIAAKLSIGYTLDELTNDITGKTTPASFEPTIDYVVTKIPRFNFEKFNGCNDRLTTQMKSVGEVMAIGSSFQESLQKAIQGLELNLSGFDSKIDKLHISKKKKIKKIKKELKNAGAERIWFIADAFRMKIPLKKINALTNIDFWFLRQIKELIKIEKKIVKEKNNKIDAKFFFKIKQKGFSDARIAILTQKKEEQIRKIRYKLNLHPTYKRVDTCAAEFPTQTAYMYSTWSSECESHPTKKKNKIIILGGGPNRIGQGIEFDYCCVHAAQALKRRNYEVVMINCNPETVSTDYDISDRLYFEPITLENILEIYKIEKPKGVIIQYGGQTPLKLSKQLKEYNVNVVGTSPSAIEKSEDRNKFQKIIKKLNLNQPKNAIISNIKEAIKAVKKISFPIMIRPSYVLGGRSMKIINNKKELKKYFKYFVKKKKKPTLLLDQYLKNAKEIDVDAICDGKTVFIGGIIEHIEQAGIHSGDSAASLPTYSIKKEIIKKIKEQVYKIAINLSVIGLINVQFALQNNKLYVLEVNPRASRSVPFISKAIGILIADIGAQVMCGKTLEELKCTKEIIPHYYSIKESVFPFNKFIGVNPALGPEMRSTGEVMGTGKKFYQAFLNALLGAGINIQRNKKRALISVKKEDNKNIVKLVYKLKKYGFKLDTTKKTYEYLKKKGIDTKRVYKKEKNKKNNVEQKIKKKKYSYIINTFDEEHNLNKKKLICQIALQNNIHYDTTINAAKHTIEILNKKNLEKNYIYSLQELHTKIHNLKKNNS